MAEHEWHHRLGVEPDTDKPVVMLSIEDHHAEAIFEGIKKYEYRRTAPGVEGPFSSVLYASSPVQAIVGGVWFRSVITAYVNVLIDETSLLTPSTKEELHEYFEGKEKGNALDISGWVVYDEPIELSEIREVVPDFSPPQNFRYLKPGRDDEILGMLPYERGIRYDG